MKHPKTTAVFACLTCVAAVICLLPTGALAQANSRIGTWSLDLARSSYQQGQAPAKETRTYAVADEGAIQMTADIVLPSGTKQPTGYRAKSDGKDYPYSGAVGDSIAISGDGLAWDATIKMHGKITQTAHADLSKDGATMTVVAKTASGRAVSTRVYTRQ